MHKRIIQKNKEAKTDRQTDKGMKRKQTVAKTNRGREKKRQGERQIEREIRTEGQNVFTYQLTQVSKTGKHTEGQTYIYINRHRYGRQVKRATFPTPVQPR